MRNLVSCIPCFILSDLSFAVLHDDVQGGDYLANSCSLSAIPHSTSWSAVPCASFEAELEQ